MTKKQLIGYLLIFVTIGLLIAYIVFPIVRSFLTDFVLNPLSGAFAGVTTAITTSGFWLTYIGPNIALISLLVGWITMFAFLHWLWPKRTSLMGQQKTTYAPQTDVTSSAPVPITSQVKSAPQPIEQQKKEEAVAAS